MSERTDNYVEGLELVQRIVVQDKVTVHGMPVWKIDNAVIIENSRIIFYIKEFGCFFDVAVKQGKGQGAHYVRHWTKLPKNVMKLLAWWIAQDQDFIESYHIHESLLEKYKESVKITSGDFAGRMLLFKNPDKPDEFKLDYTKTRELLGKNGDLKILSSS